ncbi:MAG: hypothetical protein U9R58_14500 [Chloroflexota bacterium]|nr:hypothetical protein [Chloroflexota bacterium]
MKDYEQHLSEGPQTALEKLLIEAFLQEKGYTREDLNRMPIEEASALMREACMYASLKLAEIESRARFRREIKAPD